MDRQALMAFDASLGRKISHVFVGTDIFLSAVGVAAKVESVYSNEDVLATQSFSPSKREGEKNRIAGWHIGYWNAVGHGLQSSALGNRNVIRKRGPAELPQIDVHDDVPFDAPLCRDALCRLKFNDMTLFIVKGHRVQIKSLRLSDRQRSSRVKA